MPIRPTADDTLHQIRTFIDKVHYYSSAKLQYHVMLRFHDETRVADFIGQCLAYFYPTNVVEDGAWAIPTDIGGSLQEGMRRGLVRRKRLSEARNSELSEEISKDDLKIDLMCRDCLALLRNGDWRSKHPTENIRKAKRKKMFAKARRLFGRFYEPGYSMPRAKRRSTMVSFPVELRIYCRPESNLRDKRASVIDNQFYQNLDKAIEWLIRQYLNPSTRIKR